MNNSRILFQKLVQNAWFLMGIPTSRIGYYKGLHSTLKKRAHRRLKRQYHISIVGNDHYRTSFAPNMVYWMNERLTSISAGLNDVSEQTDAVLIHLQDPLKPERQADLIHRCEHEWADKLILNHPAQYNRYHDEDCFPMLRRNGIHVPRTEFTDADVGVTKVVYKQIGKHASEKRFEKYSGEIPGYRAFEFIDCRDADGFFSRNRAYYILGQVAKSFTYTGRDPNVNSFTLDRIEPVQSMSSQCIHDITQIGKRLDIDFFAVDFINSADGISYIVDINIYPTSISIHQNDVAARRSYGLWSQLDWVRQGDLNGWDIIEQELPRMILEFYEQS